MSNAGADYVDRLHELAAAPGDRRARANAAVVARHVDAELNGQLDIIMSTLVADPLYHAYNLVDGNGVAICTVVRGAPDVRKMYDEGIRSGSLRRQWFDVDRLVGNADCLVAEGRLTLAMSGRALRALGYVDVAKQALYLYEGRCCVIYPFDDTGLLLGEDLYYEADGFIGIRDRRGAQQLD